VWNTAGSLAFRYGVSQILNIFATIRHRFNIYASVALAQCCLDGYCAKNGGGYFLHNTASVMKGLVFGVQSVLIMFCRCFFFD